MLVDFLKIDYGAATATATDLVGYFSVHADVSFNEIQVCVAINIHYFYDFI
jgi:hypothetical protein